MVEGQREDTKGFIIEVRLAIGDWRLTIGELLSMVPPIGTSDRRHYDSCPLYHVYVPR